MAEMTTREAAEQALVEAGFVQDKSNPYKWTRPSKLKWVDDDVVHLLPYSTKETGRRFLATMTLYVNDEDVLTLLRGASPSLTEEQREALEAAIECTEDEQFENQRYGGQRGELYAKRLDRYVDTLRSLLTSTQQQTASPMVSLEDVEKAFTAWVFACEEGEGYEETGISGLVNVKKAWTWLLSRLTTRTEASP